MALHRCYQSIVGTVSGDVIKSHPSIVDQQLLSLILPVNHPFFCPKYDRYAWPGLVNRMREGCATDVDVDPLAIAQRHADTIMSVLLGGIQGEVLLF